MLRSANPLRFISPLANNRNLIQVVINIITTIDKDYNMLLHEVFQGGQPTAYVLIKDTVGYGDNTESVAIAVSNSKQKLKQYAASLPQAAEMGDREDDSFTSDEVTYRIQPQPIVVV